MVNRWKIKCIVCDKKDSFEDAKDVLRSHWQILSWNVGTGEPICICDTCEYNPTKKKKL